MGTRYTIQVKTSPDAIGRQNFTVYRNGEYVAELYDRLDSFVGRIKGPFDHVEVE